MSTLGDGITVELCKFELAIVGEQIAAMGQQINTTSQLTTLFI